MRRGERHFGLDWLRIAAFGLLIFYHVGMVFAPWSWVIKTDHTYPELIVPMALLTPWRLPLLFAVSGYASRKLFERAPGDFPRSRALRLLVPLAFGMVAIVPLEMWVRVMETGYARPYLHFWAVDYWRVGRFHGAMFPSWEHLWFVAYLAAYTLPLAMLLAWRPALLDRLDRSGTWLARGWRLLWVAIPAMAAMRLALLFVVAEEQGLLTDWTGHAQFVPAFVFGFVLAGAPALWEALARLWRPALILAAASGVVVVATELAFPGEAVPPHAIMALDRACRTAMAWSMIVTLFHFADRHWNRDHRWRKPLGEAVFPAYLVHQSAIVLIAWYTLPLDLGPAAEFALLAAGTLAVCAAVYLGGRRLRWLRPLIGLAALARAHRSDRLDVPHRGAP